MGVFIMRASSCVFCVVVIVNFIVYLHVGWHGVVARSPLYTFVRKRAIVAQLISEKMFNSVACSG